MSLTKKYRPNSFKRVFGNADVKKSLIKILKRDNDSIPKTFLFHGPAGCGKTTLGRVLASSVGAIGRDFKEMDVADFRGIDTAREIKKLIRYQPVDEESTCRVWLLDECHKLTADAQNALLKSLEEPPSHIYFILCTTDPQKLLKTIRSRCVEFEVGPLSEKESHRLLTRISKKEGATLPDEAKELIYESCDGSPRDMLNTLEKIIDAPEDDMAEIIKRETQAQENAIELCRTLMGKGQSNWKKVANLLKQFEAQKEDPEGLRRMVLGYGKSVLLKGANAKIFLVMEEFEEPFYNTGWPGIVLACYRVFFNPNGDPDDDVPF